MSELHPQRARLGRATGLPRERRERALMKGRRRVERERLVGVIGGSLDLPARAASIDCRRVRGQGSIDHRPQRRRIGAAPFSLHVPRELRHEARAAPARPRDRGGHVGFALHAVFIRHAQQSLREHARVPRRERPHEQLAHIADRLAPRHAPEQRAHQIDRGAVLAPVAEQEQQRGRVRLRDQIEQQGRAVGVVAVEIVDPEHDPPPLRDAPEERAQGGRGPAADLVRVGSIGDRRRGGHHGRLLQHRKEPRQRREIGHRERLALASRQAPQVIREPCDQRRQRRIRRHLPIIAGPGQEHEAGLRRDPVDEAPAQRARAHARGAVHQHGHRVRARRAERLRERLGVVLAPEEREISGRADQSSFTRMLIVVHAALGCDGSTFQSGEPYWPSMRTMRNLLACGSTWKKGRLLIAEATEIGAPARRMSAPTTL
ncbi:MAG: hypothetical protein QM820_58020 [Minicystis sp.]